MLLSHEDEISSRRWDLSALRFLENCADPIVFDQCKELLTRLAPHGLGPNAIKPSWGMAETYSVTIIAHDTQSLFQRENASYTTVGKPFPGLNVRIVTDDGGVARTGEVGRLQVQDPMVLAAYWNRDPQLDFQDDWFETGDQAVITRNTPTIVGRDKDVIIVNGNNFVAYAFERAIDQVAGVVRSLTAVTPVRFAQDATDRVAVFVCRDGQVDDDDKIVRDIVEAMTVRPGVGPDYVPFFDPADVPKTSVGKIQKPRLAKRLTANFTQFMTAVYLSRFGTDVFAAFVYCRNVLIPVTTATTLAFSNTTQIFAARLQGEARFTEAKQFLNRNLSCFLPFVLIAVTAIWYTFPYLFELIDSDPVLMIHAAVILFFLIFIETFRSAWRIIDPALRSSGYARVPVLFFVASQLGIVLVGYVMVVRLGMPVELLLTVIAIGEGLFAVLLFLKWNSSAWVASAKSRLFQDQEDAAPLSSN